MIRGCFYLLLFLCFVSGCNRKPRASDGNETSIDRREASSNVNLRLTEPLRYSAGYEVTYHEGYTVVDVRDPWRKERLLQRYLLVERDKPIPEAMPAGTVIRVPLRNMVVYTSVHAAKLDALDAIDEIVGVCESRHIRVSAVKTRIEDGSIKDLGEASLPNIERMIEIGAEVVIASPFEHGSYGAVEKIGIPIIELAEYMETDPLGRAEWIKLLGLLTGRGERADSLFRETETNYSLLKTLAETWNIARN
jgi:iron complex transport system substrate-binding protein